MTEILWLFVNLWAEVEALCRDVARFLALPMIPLLLGQGRAAAPAKILVAAQARRLEASGLDPALLQRVIAPVKLEGVNLSSGDRNRTTEAIRFGLATVAGMLAYIGIIASGAMLFQGVLEEKTSRVVEVLAGSVRPVQMMAGKVLGLGLLSLSQYLTWALGWLFLITFGYYTLGDAVNMATPALMAYLLLYRAALLTYGSRPTLAQVWRYLKS